RLSNSENTIYALTSELKNQKGGQENANSINDSTAFEVEKEVHNKGNLVLESKDFKVKGQEEFNSTDRNNFSPIRLSIYENLSNDIKGEGDTHKKNQQKVRLLDSKKAIRAPLDEPNTHNLFSLVRLSDSENMINALMGESNTHKEHHENVHSESYTSKQGAILDCANVMEDREQSLETNTVNNQSNENVELKSKDSEMICEAIVTPRQRWKHRNAT
nr:hypothetical protein [Tanacetum cinerariifolium]